MNEESEKQIKELEPIQLTLLDVLLDELMNK
jgi:hypothetical protein